MKILTSSTLLVSTFTAFSSLAAQMPLVTGWGYSHDHQGPAAAQCLSMKNTPTFYSEPSSTTLHSVEPYKASMEAGVFFVRGGIDNFLNSDKIRYFDKIDNSSPYSESLVYVTSHVLGEKKFQLSGYGSSALNSLAQSAYNEGAKQFRNLCGDSFVWVNELGAKLFISITVNFKTANDKELFNSDVKYKDDLDLQSVLSKVKQFNKSHKSASSVTVRAFQVGGSSSDLNEVLPGEFKTCDSTNLDSCEEAVQSLASYANNSFPSQVKYEGGHIIGYPTSLSFQPFNYADIGIKTGASEVTDGVRKARVALTDLLWKTESNYVTVNHYLHSPVVTSSEKSNLSTLALNLRENLDTLKGGGDTGEGGYQCFANPSQCELIASNLESEIVPVKQSDIDYFTKKYPGL